MDIASRNGLRQQCAIVLFSLFFASYGARGEGLPPAPERYFNDYAGVISEDKRNDLNDRLAKFDQNTTNQVVIAIFQRMDSTLPLDEYTLRLANSWRVGQRGKNNGVTLFIFVQDHTMRIQVGYGLTGVLTDAFSKQILDQELKPRFERGDFEGGTHYRRRFYSQNCRRTAIIRARCARVSATSPRRCR